MNNIQKYRAAPRNLASRFGERFFVKARLEKRRNTVCISSFSNHRIGGKDPAKREGAIAQCWLIYPPLKALCKIEAEKSNANAVDENSRCLFFTRAEQTLHTQSLRQPIGIIFTPSGRVYASSPPVMTINKSGSRRFVLPEAFAVRTSCLI